MQGQLTLITGGARSGKSNFAHRLALRSGEDRLFVATAQAYDAEMQRRIELHQAERGSHYRTLEANIDMANALRALAPADVILIDCLTLWVSQLMFADYPDEAIETMIGEGIAVARSQAAHVILVSNEVGFGIVPDNALARRFRDLNGRLQQLLAQSADQLYLACMGRVLPLHTLGLSPEAYP